MYRAKIKKDEKKRDSETGKVVVEGVMIGQVPTTRRDNERKKASRELVAFPETPPPTRCGRIDKRSCSRPFHGRNRDDKFPSNGNER